jgi:hypothetical protein
MHDYHKMDEDEVGKDEMKCITMSKRILATVPDSAWHDVE